MSNIERIKSIPPDELSHLVHTLYNTTAILKALHIVPNDNRARKVLQNRCSELNLHMQTSRRPDVVDDQTFVEYVQQSICWSDLLRLMGLSPHGSNSKTVKDRCTRLGLSVEHFSLSDARARNNKQLDQSLLTNNSTAHRSSIRKIVLQDNLLPYKCNRCGITEWQGEELTLQLDHIDGDITNNQLSNLRFLCPNCHSLTPTFGRKRRD